MQQYHNNNYGSYPGKPAHMPQQENIPYYGPPPSRLTMKIHGARGVDASKAYIKGTYGGTSFRTGTEKVLDGNVTWEEDKNFDIVEGGVLQLELMKDKLGPDSALANGALSIKNSEPFTWNGWVSLSGTGAPGSIAINITYKTTL